MSSFNRIPRDSVSFSESYRFDTSKIKEKNWGEDESQSEFEKEADALEQRKKELEEKESWLREVENGLEITKQNIEVQKQKNEEELSQKMQEHERQKRRDYYDMREFMFKCAVELAEDLVGQKINSGDFSMKRRFEGIIKSLPIAFDELEITVHPETLMNIEKESDEASWILKDIKWKRDYSLKIGEFIIEEESEYYDSRFNAIFEKIRENLNLDEKGTGGKDANDDGL